MSPGPAGASSSGWTVKAVKGAKAPGAARDGGVNRAPAPTGAEAVSAAAYLLVGIPLRPSAAAAGSPGSLSVIGNVPQPRAARI